MELSHLQKFAQERASLELSHHMQSELSKSVGLDNTVMTMLRVVQEALHCAKVQVYYWIDTEIHLEDAMGYHTVVERINDPLVNRVMQDRICCKSLRAILRRIGDADLQNNSDWAYPLICEEELIGIVKIENAFEAIDHLQPYLEIFFSFAALSLKAKRLGYTQLKQMKDLLEKEIIYRRASERDLEKSKAELELRIKEQTEHLAATNSRLQIELEERLRIEMTLRRSNRSYQALAACSQLMAVAESESILFEGLCQILTDSCGYEQVHLHYAQFSMERHSSSSFSGIKSGTHLSISLLAEIEDSVLHSFNPVLFPDISNDKRLDQWLESFAASNMQSYCIFPFHSATEERGVIHLLSTQTNAFSQDEVQLFKEITKLVVNALAQMQQKELRIQTNNDLIEKSLELDNFFNLSHDLLCIVDDQGNFIRLNLAWERLLGIPTNILLNTPFRNYVYPPDIPTTEVQMQALLEGKEVVDYVNRYLDSHGTIHDIEWRALMHDGYVYASARNISERKKLEATLSHSLHEKETLLQELYHRTKNNMHVICSMLDIQAAELHDEDAKASYAEMSVRIRTMALVHQKLYQAKNLSRVNMLDYLQDLVELIQKSFNSKYRYINIQVECSDIQLLIDSAIPCGLLVTELITNAFKHAFQDSSIGTIQIKLEDCGESTLKMSIRDDGTGFPANFDPRKNGKTGLAIVYGIAEQQMQGKVNVTSDANGTVWVIKFNAQLYQERV